MEHIGVLLRDPLGKFTTQALLCTDVEATPEAVVNWFIQRWQLEVTFEEARRHLGLESNRQWSEKAIKRTTPCLLGLYSVVTLLAARLCEEQKMVVRRAAWQAKEGATFADALAAVRHCIWSSCSFQTSGKEGEMIKIPSCLLERLTDTLCYAA